MVEVARTDKDAPRWVRNSYNCNARIVHDLGDRYCSGRPPASHPCPLPETLRGSECRFEAYEPHRFPFGGDASRRRRNAMYYVPERQAVRRAERAAVRDYNRYGDTDLIVPTTPHRHSTWGGGWWD